MLESVVLGTNKMVGYDFRKRNIILRPFNGVQKKYIAVVNSRRLKHL